MADRVMRSMSTGNEAPSIQRKCQECAEEDVQRQADIQRQTDDDEEEILLKSDMSAKAEGSGQLRSSPSFEASLSQTNGSGEPLRPSIQREMNMAFAADFSQVRVHTDDVAARMNRDVGARAFTHGKHIYFNEGQYQPHSAAGKHLLAHELTHTLQQGAVPSVQKKYEIGQILGHTIQRTCPNSPASIPRTTPTSIDPCQHSRSACSGAGASDCDLITPAGYTANVANNNTCVTTDCTRDHELQHGTDLSNCCNAAARAIAAHPADADQIRAAYEHWLCVDGASAFSEVNAHRISVDCAMELMNNFGCDLQTCYPPDTDCNDIVRYFLRKKHYLSKFRIIAPSTMPDCPFT